MKNKNSSNVTDRDLNRENIIPHLGYRENGASPQGESADMLSQGDQGYDCISASNSKSFRLSFID